MRSIKTDDLHVEVKGENGTLVASFTCINENELDKLNNADILQDKVIVHVKNFRLFVGNAVVVPYEEGGFCPP